MCDTSRWIEKVIDISMVQGGRELLSCWASEEIQRIINEGGEK